MAIQPEVMAMRSRTVVFGYQLAAMNEALGITTLLLPAKSWLAAMSSTVRRGLGHLTRWLARRAGQYDPRPLGPGLRRCPLANPAPHEHGNISADLETRNVADLLRGTPRLNVPISRTVFGVSGQCRVAVIGLKPIDRTLDDRCQASKWRSRRRTVTHNYAPGVERIRERCEFIAQAPPPAEGQADGQAREAVAGTERGGDGIQGSPGNGDRGRAHRRPASPRRRQGRRQVHHDR